MDPRLLRLYNDELAYMRGMGQEFAQAFPKIAGRLGMESQEIADPYVERLMEGFAFLAARVQLKLQSRFPDFTQHLLELVYPHFLAPVPSMAIVALKPDPDAGRLEQGASVPRGTRLISQLAQGSVTQCYFHTGHDVHLWAMEVRAVDYYTTSGALAALRLPEHQDVKAALRVVLKTTNGQPFSRLALRRLQLHLAGAGGIGACLTEQLLATCKGIVARPALRPAPWQEFIAPDALRQRGLDREDALLPEVPRSFDGYRLLQEYLALPERACFVELDRLADAVGRLQDTELELVFLLGRVEPRLERRLGPANIELFATPAINLFDYRADPLDVSDRHHEHHIVADRTRALDLEIHSILEVEGEYQGDVRAQPFLPFYSIEQRGMDAQAGYYTLRREPRLLSSLNKRRGPRTGYVGSELFIQLADQRSGQSPADLRQLAIRCRCTNRDLPLLLPIGQGQTDFSLEIGAPVLRIRCLNGPTRPRQSRATGDVAWDLISHLSLNYLSITEREGGDAQGADALREILRLYTEDGDPILHQQVAGIRRVRSRPIVRRLPGGGQAAVARGLEIELLVDETAFEGVGSFPLGAVLSRFFTKYASINSFTETVLRTEQRGEIMRWPMMNGRRATV